MYNRGVAQAVGRDGGRAQGSRYSGKQGGSLWGSIFAAGDGCLFISCNFLFPRQRGVVV